MEKDGAPGGPGVLEQDLDSYSPLEMDEGAVSSTPLLPSPLQPVSVRRTTSPKNKKEKMLALPQK